MVARASNDLNVSRVDGADHGISVKVGSVKGYQVRHAVNDHRRDELRVVDLCSAHGILRDQIEPLVECSEAVGQNGEVLSDKFDFL